jgi:MinD-like ATPase involved in chromosome partitioning or flagellar assembly
LGLAQEFVRFREKKTLYVNFEEWDRTGKYFESTCENKLNTIGDFLYYSSRERTVNLDSFLEADEYGIRHFKPVSGRNQLKNLTNEEFSCFTNNLIGEECFHYIIFDCSNSLDENTLWLLQNSNRLICLSEKHPSSIQSDWSANEDPAILFLKEEFKTGGPEKLIKVLNMNEMPDGEMENSEIIFIEQDPGSFHLMKGIVQINIERGFGQGIRQLADEIECI